MTVSNKNKRILAELKQLREDKDIRLADLARELGMSQGQLSMHESGVRSFINYDINSFAEDYKCAVDKIHQFNCEFEVDRDGLVWKKVTSDRLTKAMELKSCGHNIVQISMELGVDESSLEKLLGDDCGYQSVLEELELYEEPV